MRIKEKGDKGKFGLQAVDTAALAVVLARGGKTLDDVRQLFQFFVRDAARLQAGLARIRLGKLALGRAKANPNKAKRAKAKPAKKAATQAAASTLAVRAGGVRKKPRSAATRRARHFPAVAEAAQSSPASLVDANTAAQSAPASLAVAAAGLSSDADCLTDDEEVPLLALAEHGSSGDSDDEAVVSDAEAGSDADGDDTDSESETAAPREASPAPLAADMEAQRDVAALAASQAKQQGLFFAILHTTLLLLPRGAAADLAALVPRLSVRLAWDEVLDATELPKAVRSVVGRCVHSVALQAQVGALMSALAAAAGDACKRVLAFEVVLDGETLLFAASAELRGSDVMVSLLDSSAAALGGVHPAAVSALWRASLLALLARAQQCGATRAHWVSCAPEWIHDAAAGTLTRNAYLLPPDAALTLDVRGKSRAEVLALALALHAKHNALLKTRFYPDLIQHGTILQLLAPGAGAVAPGAAAYVPLFEDDLVTKKLLELARAVASRRFVPPEGVPLLECALEELRSVGYETFAAALAPPPAPLAALAATYTAQALLRGGDVSQAVHFGAVARNAQAALAARLAKPSPGELPGSCVRRAMHLGFYNRALAQADAAAE